MDRRYITFFLLSFAVVALNFTIVFWMQKNQQAQQAAQANAPAEKKPDGKKPGEKNPDGEKPAEPRVKPDVKKQAEADDGAPDKAGKRKEPPAAWVTLGSADPAAPYRMLVTFTNRGAAVERVELNSPRFHDLEDRSGYLGNLAGAKAPKNAGCLVQTVGQGTPAARAGLRVGDVITALSGDKVTGYRHLNELLRERVPGEVVELTVDRQGKKQTLSATLARRPLEVIRPEPDGRSPVAQDPLSFLFTFDQVGKAKLGDNDSELPGVHMRTSNWEILPRNPKKPDQVAFAYVLEQQRLRVLKTYSLAKVAAAEQSDPNAPAYHLNLRIDIENTGEKARPVAYRLDGPTGMPIEGWWYSKDTKIGHTGNPGVRDVVWYGQEGGQKRQIYQITASQVADENPPTYSEVDVLYAGVDAQYVAAVLIPQNGGDGFQPFAKLLPLRVGPVPANKNKKKLVDTSCRLVSTVQSIEAGESLSQAFQIFVGPKRPDLLAQYAQPHNLGDLVYYGWFGWVSRPMLSILHFFYRWVPNYGLAIIMLTVLVRSCMFPLSRHQALSAAKMQQLQPEMKKMAEKYKDPQERMKAQREFFRKHDYHPLSGCLPALVQLPIFLGLYRSLAVDIELRQAPLISSSIRWCSNLGAPDMLWYWKPYLPIDFLTDEANGYLGPYLNLLPLITISLFIVQQKLFMPPPTDEQSAMQAKMMKYMMIFMGVMFFKVASGLCLYFIASSLWGIAERKLLPKPAPPKAGDAPARLPPAPGGNGSGGGAAARKKQRPRR
ncbi:MAG TPA: YidC/Oxa1 family insertase periplasmic-domain containing protein [Pirellulales bacterium]